MNVLFIITGSIAIIKCIEILAHLKSKQIFVDCIITDNAKKMIKLKDLKKNINGSIFTNKNEKNNRMLHIELTRKSHLIIICPATANIIAKFANGYADDLASTALIASNKQKLIFPAMNTEMWENPINKKNVSNLKKIGVEFIGPEYGSLACGEVGLGRLTNSKKISEIIIKNLNKSLIFKGKKCLITAGPTIEPIDKIRYISNYSSGKQGYEIAKQMILLGAKVILISGPTNLSQPLKSKFIKIKTAKEMLKAVKKNLKVDIAIFTAAVSDVSPKKIYNTKIKKNNLSKIDLKKNRDILHEVSSLKKNRPQIVVGFAAETNNHINNAKKKLLQKKCDAIVVNKIDQNNKVFNSNMNKISFITKSKTLNFSKMSKANVAKKIAQLINNLNI